MDTESGLTSSELKAGAVELPDSAIVHVRQGFFRVDNKDGEKVLTPVVAIKDDDEKVYYDNMLVRSHSKQRLIYKTDGYYVESGGSVDSGYFSCMVNGVLISQESVKVNPGDEVILRNGRIVTINENDDGTISLLTKDGNITGEEKAVINETVASLDPQEIDIILREEFDRIGHPELFDKLVKDRLSGLVDIRNVFSNAKDLSSRLIGFNTSKLTDYSFPYNLAKGVILEYVYNNFGVIRVLLDRMAKSSYFSKARRLDYETARYRSFAEQRMLKEEFANLPEAIAKAADMWNGMLGANPEEQDLIVEERLGELSPEVADRIRRLSAKLFQRKYDDGEVKELLDRYFQIGYSMAVIPLEGRVFNNYLKALLIEDEYSREAFPYIEASAEEHRARFSNFWGVVFKETGIDRPDWFGDCSYKPEEVKYFFRANAGDEYVCGKPGCMFLDIEVTSEALTDILDHEATHRILNRNGTKRNTGSKDCVPDTNKYNEIVVEFTRQLYKSIRLNGDKVEFYLPGEVEFTSDYQGGVEELVAICRESGMEGEEVVYAVVKGIIDYEDGLVGNPLEYIKGRYQEVVGKQDFDDRLMPKRVVVWGNVSVRKGEISEIPHGLADRYRNGVFWWD